MCEKQEEEEIIQKDITTVSDTKDKEENLGRQKACHEHKQNSWKRKKRNKDNEILKTSLNSLEKRKKTDNKRED